MRLQHARLFLLLTLTLAGTASRAMPVGAAAASVPMTDATAANASAIEAAAAAGADLFDELYARSQPIDATVKTIHAAFTETTSSPLLQKPLVAEGTLHVVRPFDVEMVYTKPERKNVTIKGGQMLFTWPDRQMKQERDISEALGRIEKYFVAKSPKELRRHFTIAASEDKERAGTYRVDMTPKRKQIEQGLTRLELWLRKDTLLLDAMRMHFPGDSVKMMEFRDVVVNKGAGSGAATPSTPR